MYRLTSTQHIIGHFGDDLSSQSLDLCKVFPAKRLADASN